MKHLKIPSWHDCIEAVANERKTGEPPTALEKFVNEYEVEDTLWRPMLAAVLADMMPQGAKVEW